MPGEQDKAKNVQEPCRLAALIYTNMVFRRIQPSAAIHTTLTSCLRTILIQNGLVSCWENLYETLLWVLFIGGAVAVKRLAGPGSCQFDSSLLSAKDTVLAQYQGNFVKIFVV
jgi:hypothetical protein